jgi:hypothetical protein
MGRKAPSGWLLSTPTFFSSRGDWSQHLSTTMSLPYKGRNLPSVKPDDGEIYAGTCGDIMMPGNKIRHSPYPETKPRKWEKLPTNECTEKGVTPAAAIVDKLKIGSES